MKVTIGIPTHNREMWIANAIESALGQTWPNKEVIVVDDGSTDRTAEICARYSDWMTFVRQDHLGGNAARNHILRLAKGDWLQYLDDDDYLLPDKLEVQLTSVAREKTLPEVIFSRQLCELWENGVAVKRWCLPITETNEPLKTWLRDECGQIGAYLIQRKSLEAIGGWDESLAAAQDMELWMRMILNNWCFHFVDAALSVWRWWSGRTICSSNLKGVQSMEAALIDRLQKELTSRGEWNDSLQFLADEARFKIARGLAYTCNVSEAMAYYSQQFNNKLARYRYAASSRTVTVLYRLLGFESAFQLVRILRGIKSRYRQV
jgi:glycosyltransferase involved in cell wall biosynthesis